MQTEAQRLLGLMVPCLCADSWGHLQALRGPLWTAGVSWVDLRLHGGLVLDVGSVLQGLPLPSLRLPGTEDVAPGDDPVLGLASI